MASPAKVSLLRPPPGKPGTGQLQPFTSVGSANTPIDTATSVHQSGFNHRSTSSHSHLEAVTIELRKGSGIRERVESTTSDRAAPGAKPGGMVASRVTVIADVVAVNARTQTLTLRGPQRTVNLRVPDPKQFAVVKVGDQVEATFTEAVAVAVEPAPKR